MITETNVRGVQNGKKLVRLAFKSTDSKPTTGIMNGSTAIEVNTGKQYVFDEESGDWTEIASSGGGGGGGGSSDFSTAEVTINNSASDSFIDFTGIIIDNDTIAPMVSLSEATSVLTVVLYKNIQHLYINADSVTSISGNISGDMLDGFDVTGDCVINAVGYSDMG